MATTEVVPNVDTILKQWSEPASGDHYDNIDEGSVGMPDANFIRASQANGDDNDIDGFGMQNPDIEGGTASQIVVHTYGHIGLGTAVPEIRLVMAGAGFDETQECNLPGMLPGERTNTFTPDGDDWTEWELSWISIAYIADVPISKSENKIFTCFAVITYEPPAPAGWGHKFIGVPGANIANVNGVPLANIASIKGVVI